MIVGNWRRDPGPCIVDGTPHTACTGPSAEIAVVQLPARDAAAAAVVGPAPLRAEVIQATLPANTFTTGTYRGTNPKRRRR
jgi:hypothetical protein